MPTPVQHLVGLLALVLLGSCTRVDTPGAELQSDARASVPARRVILMIGDGMGRGQIAAAAEEQGAPLFMESLEHRGEVVTSSLSGITDSAAAATAMATGVVTYNGRVGVGPDGKAQESLLERARAAGMASAVVTSSYLSHATPAAFSAHQNSRHLLEAIASEQASAGPDIMLGGGAEHFAGHLSAMAESGYELVRTAEELRETSAERVLGLFAPEHMDYVLDREAASRQPSLSEMSLAALDLLNRDEEGFMLVIEGARIDMASHDNDIARTISETLDFDAAVASVASWAAEQDDVLLVVTADHECGGLRSGEGQEWRWGQHTNARVDVFAQGPGSELLDGALVDHRWIHALLRAQLTGEALLEPALVLVPDGELGDLRHKAASQSLESDFGKGYNQLDALWLDADARGLAIGLEGLFQWQQNAVAVLIDVDFGAGTGHASLQGALLDSEGPLDALLSSARLSDPGIAGFGIDLAVGSLGGMESHYEDLLEDAGARGIAAPLGSASDLAWLGSSMNFGEGVRASTRMAPAPGRGLEVFLPWSVLYPDLAGAVPVGATLAISAVLLNEDGSYTSNQALPAFSAQQGSPGEASVPLPGVVRFAVDSDGDGIGDGNAAPSILPSAD